MSTITVPRHREQAELREAAAALHSAHARAAQAAAALDLDDPGVWAAADGLITALAAEAYWLTSRLSGDPPVAPAVRLPPVVRLRELAVAQRALAARLPAPADPADQDWFIAHARRSTARVDQLRRLLSYLAGTETGIR